MTRCRFLGFFRSSILLAKYSVRAAGFSSMIICQKIWSKSSSSSSVQLACTSRGMLTSCRLEVCSLVEGSVTTASFFTVLSRMVSSLIGGSFWMNGELPMLPVVTLQSIAFNGSAGCPSRCSFSRRICSMFLTSKLDGSAFDDVLTNLGLESEWQRWLFKFACRNLHRKLKHFPCCQRGQILWLPKALGSCRNWQLLPCKYKMNKALILEFSLKYPMKSKWFKKNSIFN